MFKLIVFKNLVYFKDKIVIVFYILSKLKKEELSLSISKILKFNV